MRCRIGYRGGLTNYISHEVQNTFLKVMALDILRNIADKLQKSPYLTIMITDVSNQEQEQVTIV